MSRAGAPVEQGHRNHMAAINSINRAGSIRAAVESEIALSEESHTAITRRHFNLNWRDAEHYDVVLNTERVSVGECVEGVLELVNSEEFAETDASRQRLQDLALAWRVKAALRLSPKTRDLHVTVTAQRGRVTLAGMLETSEERTEVNEVAALAGATEIDDTLRTADAIRARFS